MQRFVCVNQTVNPSRSDSVRFVTQSCLNVVPVRSNVSIMGVSADRRDGLKRLDCLWLLLHTLKSDRVISYCGRQPDHHQTSPDQLGSACSCRPVIQQGCHMQESLDDPLSSAVVCIVYLLFLQWSWVRMTLKEPGANHHSECWHSAPPTLSVTITPDQPIFYFLILSFSFKLYIVMESAGFRNRGMWINWTWYLRGVICYCWNRGFLQTCLI